jgi:hypothetical protein
MWYHEHAGGVMLQIKVQASAKSNQVVGVNGDFLKIKISAVPAKGKANDELCTFLSDVFNLAKSRVNIVKGKTRSTKLVFIPIRTEQISALLSKKN